MQLYSPIIIKLALGIICLILQMNLMGKSNLAPTSALDQVQNYVLGGIIGGVIYSDSISILQFILVLIIWTLLVLTVKYLKEHNRHIKKIIDGQPITIISNGKVDVNQCMRCGISANELMFKLRSSGVYEVEKIKRAIVEQNGQLTLLEFGDENIKYPIINDGQTNFDVLEIIKKDEEWLSQEVKRLSDKTISEIYLGEYISGEIRLYPYEK